MVSLTLRAAFLQFGISADPNLERLEHEHYEEEKTEAHGQGRPDESVEEIVPGDHVSVYLHLIGWVEEALEVAVLGAILLVEVVHFLCGLTLVRRLAHVQGTLKNVKITLCRFAL